MSKTKVEQFAMWLKTCEDPVMLLSHLKNLICMRCGTPRPDIIEMSKGGPRCCYREID